MVAIYIKSIHVNKLPNILEQYNSTHQLNQLRLIAKDITAKTYQTHRRAH